MVKKISSFLLAVFTAISFVGCSANSDATVDNKISITAPISENEEFKQTYFEVSSETFFNTGFEYGDSCSVTFANGKTYEDVPFYSGFYDKLGTLIIVDYQGSEYIEISRCFSGSSWNENDCKVGDEVTITLTEKGKYLATQETMCMEYSVNREDFSSDEKFANFRVISCEGLKKDTFYRGASPINNLYNRAKYADDLIEKAQINFILDLSDNADKIATFQEDEAFDSDYYMSLYNSDRVALLALDVDYSSDTYRQSLVAGLNKMIENQGPYYIHCIEGKDRTGFVCMLLECIANCSLEDIENDYMITYDNYFSVTKEDETLYNAIIDTRYNDMITFIAGVNTVDELNGIDLEKGAKQYLLDSGMSETNYDKLKAIVTE